MPQATDTDIQELKTAIGLQRSDFSDRTSAIGLATPDPLTEAAEMADRSTTPLDLYMESGGSPSTSSIGQSIVQPTTPQRTTPTTQHQGASIVMLTPLILLSLAIISIRISVP